MAKEQHTCSDPQRQILIRWEDHTHTQFNWLRNIKQDWLRIVSSKGGTADPLAAAEECVANDQRDCAQAYPPLFQRRPKQSSQTQARPKTCVRVPLCVTECLIAAALHDLKPANRPAPQRRDEAQRAVDLHDPGRDQASGDHVHSERELQLAGHHVRRH